MDKQTIYTQVNQLLKDLLTTEVIDVDRAQMIASDFNSIYQELEGFADKFIALAKIYPELLPLTQVVGDKIETQEQIKDIRQNINEITNSTL